MKVDDLVRIEFDPKSVKYKSTLQKLKTDADEDKYEIVDEVEADEFGRNAFVVQNVENGNHHTVKVVKENNLVYYVDSTDDYFQKQGKNKNDYSAPILFVCQKAGAELINVPQLETEVMEPETLAGKQKQGLAKPEQKQTPAKKQESMPAKQVKGEIPIKHQGGYYKVAGKEIEDAWKTQNLANEHGVSTRVIDFDQDSERVFAHVRGVLGDQFTETVVWHNFEVVRENILWDKVKKLQKDVRQVEFREDGQPILYPQEQADVVQRFMNFRTFALRDAITKASRIVQLKLLNREFREEEEISMEEQEVKQVNQS